ncbi:hypothetical protein NE237_022765 [Protea cynaroides]|uniref:Uncharacterized protein n=1 Tax=Protea cynaroides TaxID=273540 RepID=A0A9Q0HA92_9MAGN|nr:hypothetical protein NE237_022765 [Protea cynaroides]
MIPSTIVLMFLTVFRRSTHPSCSIDLLTARFTGLKEVDHFLQPLPRKSSSLLFPQISASALGVSPLPLSVFPPPCVCLCPNLFIIFYHFARFFWCTGYSQFIICSHSATS